MKLGFTDINSVYLGTDKLSKIFLGTEEIYTNQVNGDVWYSNFGEYSKVQLNTNVRTSDNTYIYLTFKTSEIVSSWQSIFHSENYICLNMQNYLSCWGWSGAGSVVASTPLLQANTVYNVRLYLNGSRRKVAITYDGENYTDIISYTDTTNYSVSDYKPTLGGLSTNGTGSVFLGAICLSKFKIVTNGIVTFDGKTAIEGIDYTVLGNPKKEVLSDGQSPEMILPSYVLYKSQTPVLMHFDNNLNNATTGANVIYAGTPPTFSSTIKKFGTHSALLAGDWFDLDGFSASSTDKYSGEFWWYTEQGYPMGWTFSTGAGPDRIWKITAKESSGQQIMRLWPTTEEVIWEITDLYNTWHHFAFTYHGDGNCSFFHDGKLKITKNIGSSGVSQYYCVFNNTNGHTYFDEHVMHDYERYTGDFTPQNEPYILV